MDSGFILPSVILYENIHILNKYDNRHIVDISHNHRTVHSVVLWYTTIQHYGKTVSMCAYAILLCARGSQEMPKWRSLISKQSVQITPLLTIGNFRQSYLVSGVQGRVCDEFLSPVSLLCGCTVTVGCLYQVLFYKYSS